MIKKKEIGYEKRRQGQLEEIVRWKSSFTPSFLNVF